MASRIHFVDGAVVVKRPGGIGLDLKAIA